MKNNFKDFSNKNKQKTLKLFEMILNIGLHAPKRTRQTRPANAPTVTLEPSRN